SAAAAGVDFVLPPEAIARELLRVTRHPFSGRGEALPAEPLPEEENGYHRVFALLRAHANLDFTQYKRSTVQRRIRRRMALRNHEALDDYVGRLEADPAEMEALYQDLLIR